MTHPDKENWLAVAWIGVIVAFLLAALVLWLGPYIGDTPGLR